VVKIVHISLWEFNSSKAGGAAMIGLWEGRPAPGGRPGAAGLTASIPPNLTPSER